jgi:hypothetical protein
LFHAFCSFFAKLLRFHGVLPVSTAWSACVILFNLAYIGLHSFNASFYDRSTNLATAVTGISMFVGLLALGKQMRRRSERKSNLLINAARFGVDVTGVIALAGRVALIVWVVLVVITDITWWLWTWKYGSVSFFFAAKSQSRCCCCCAG